MKLKSAVISSFLMVVVTTSSLALVEKPIQSEALNAEAEALVLQLDASVPRSQFLAPPL
jgi:hypothetical protein